MSPYFTAPDTEKFTFYRIPKLLFTDEKYQTVSADAKMLYGLLLDRLSLSEKNGWRDKHGRVYQYFTIRQAQEQKRLEGELQKALMRTETVSRLYKKAFEKNAEGLLSDEGFLQVTHEYDMEQLALKAKIPQLREQIAETERQAANKDKFIAAIRKFIQMDELTAPLLRELIDHIEVHETQGVGKSRTQRITIYYRFVGYIDIPAAPLTNHYISETRQGVAVEYIPA